ncbi:endonuclease/exonuclease/phosphatase family protein [Aestuariivirga sp.]|uniref:endonuclease/exonuclease/phosphatase family protein n=1 Tax=Aestuariivirga sp. TaxID=2650926 RepID=UPI003593D319
MRFIRWLVQAGVLGVSAVQLAGFGQAVHPLFDSVAHFRLHLAVLLALGIVLLLLVRSWRLAAAGSAMLAASVFLMSPALVRQKPVTMVNLSLLQFNTLFKNPTPTAIVAQVSRVRPDVITLQEVSKTTSIIMEQLRADYPHQVFCPFTAVGGVAVLSRHETVGEGCEEGRGFAWMRIDIRGRQVTVASVHLHWPYPFAQADQISSLTPDLSSLTQPVVIAGDFNAAPWSHQVNRIAQASHTHVAPGLRLSLKMAPLGVGPWPMLPIDHVLVPDSAVASVRILPGAGSDHLPLLARVSIPSP